MDASGDVQIVEFDEVYAAHFASLNYQWIETYFAIEPHDREMLDHPEKNIIDTGGKIFFALVNGNAVGTVAMIKETDDRFELAKMAVSPEFSGRGIGDKLMHACIDFAKRRHVSSVFLLSNTKLLPAMRLYEKHGFVETPLDPGNPYERVNICMELALGPAKR